MASPCLASLFSAASALPAGIGTRRSPPSARAWHHDNCTHHQLQRLVVAAAAAKRRYKGTARKEAALAELVERKVAEAMEACAGREAEAGCRVAWDEVEEVSQARADLRRRIAEAPGDPLEPFCADNPADDDCAVVYVDD
ncbi:hypothetical protein GQ55_6G252100 [Panicum hallii var. hallii]|uniref:CP12 domain-containing protein n=2 Tax=Panicum hallii TaxID=206008 RepID=A0A2T7D9E0_9POAL|nr:calvin cycle protein CP12-3, chloroplastic-like [Panicum hallii]PAN36203.1 hypothetical protein PAHAL_6G263600 [Panicum hallii]PUZ52211.1 hypothetical protein GQ55_6G252100 [Panicum hallii var. hallii]